MDRDEFKSTWLGNKAIYRTRMAIADGGELVVMAPGVDKFGEDPGIDALIRKVRVLFGGVRLYLPPPPKVIAVGQYSTIQYSRLDSRETRD